MCLSPKHKFLISHITNAQRVIHTDRTQIERCFLDYYSNVWSVDNQLSFRDLLNALSANHNRISKLNCTSFLKLVTKSEVYRTLCSFPSGKSPGPNCLNVDFYRFFWHDVGNHFFDAINHFFHSSTLPNSWSNTYLALIPKHDKPKIVTDYRPISLCNVCYKVITKIMADRLRNILPNLIGKEQCGFISSHSPLDNILVVQEVAHSIENNSKDPLGC